MVGNAKHNDILHYGSAFSATCFLFFFFFNDTATTEIYTLSLHDALPISELADDVTFIPSDSANASTTLVNSWGLTFRGEAWRSEEHTSELQSHSFISYAVFCLKKKKKESLVVQYKQHNIPNLSMPLAYSYIIHTLSEQSSLVIA